MFGPVVIPPLLALLVVVILLAVALYGYVQMDAPPAPMKPPARHRKINTGPQPRDWADFQSERLLEQHRAATVAPISAPPAYVDPLDHAVPLAEIERRFGVSSLQWHIVPSPFDALLDEETSELVAVA
jgi:hypothetical protein